MEDLDSGKYQLMKSSVTDVKCPLDFEIHGDQITRNPDKSFESDIGPGYSDYYNNDMQFYTSVNA